MAGSEQPGLAAASAAQHEDTLSPTTWQRVLSRGALPLVGLLFVGALALTYAQLSHNQEMLVHRTAVKSAEVYSHTLDKFREVYAKEVVHTARKTGMKVSHNYLTEANTLPLGITLSRKMEENLADPDHGTKSKIYSPFPFEWRQKEGGLKDQFAHDAWDALNESPKEPFYRVEVYDGVQSLRYAISEQMKPQCVECHNDYAGPPKTDRQEGDVRGVLEIVYPIEQAETLARWTIWETLGILTPMMLLALAMLGMMNSQQRRWTDALEERVRDQRAAQAELEQSRQRLVLNQRHLVQVLDTMPLAVVVLQPDGGTDYANEHAANMLGGVGTKGLDPSQLFLAGTQQLYPIDELPTARALAGKSTSIADVELATDRGRIPLMISGAPIFDDRGQVSLAVVAFQDMSDQQRLEHQVRQAQRMNAVGRLAGGVAHDFNNLLTAIVSFSTFAMKAISPEDKAYSDIQEVLRAADRGEDLTRQLLSFSRHHSPNVEVIDVNTKTLGVKQMLHRLLGERVSLETDFQDNVGSVRIAAGALDQIIVNLALNSRDAMPAGGEIRISTEKVLIDDDFAREHAIDCPDGEYAVITVQDNGEGMDMETERQMFDPFFTTKSHGEGTGLGLSTTWGIVRQARGKITVESGQGRGTTIAIYLPLVDPVEQSEASFPRPQTRQGEETVLVVEDDDVIRELVVRGLQEAGYKVIEAANGQDAVDICEGFPPGAIELLLTDVVMPEMNGAEVAQRVSEMHPGVAVLYMSGYTADAILRDGVVHAASDLLQKPFTPDALAAKVREVLDGAQTATGDV